MLDEIAALAAFDREILKVELIDEGYYHGDTCLCSFGRDREFLLAWLPVLEPRCAAGIRDAFGDRLIEMNEDDARIYAANSFAFQREGQPCLVMPAGVSDAVTGAIRERGVEIISVDVSEFYKKGGGSVKCMIGDLGDLRA